MLSRIKYFLKRYNNPFIKQHSRKNRSNKNQCLNLVSDWKSLHKGDQVIVCGWRKQTRIVLMSQPKLKAGHWHFLGADKQQGIIPHRYSIKPKLLGPYVLFWRTKKENEATVDDFFYSLRRPETSALFH
nr:hypothetical protein KPDKLGBK_00020 [uncultured bacterium]